MPALAAIYNEGQINVGCDIQVFYNTQLNNLAMVMKSKGPAKDLNTQYEAPDKSPVGLIVNPSQMAVARIQGINMVVGFTRKPEYLIAASATSGGGNAANATANTANAAANAGADDKEWDVSLISPVYKPLTSTLAKYSNVALSTKGDEGWVYFLTGADEASLQIHEASLTVSLANSDPVNAMPPLPGTRLAAYYNPDLDQRFIIYQLKNAPFKLFEWNIDKKDGGEIANTGDALKGTVLSVAYVKASGTAALYYTDNANNVRKIYKPKGSTWQGANSITGNNATNQVNADSQLTNTVIDGDVHLFWSANKSLEPVSHNIDKVSA